MTVARGGQPRVLPPVSNIMLASIQVESVMTDIMTSSEPYLLLLWSLECISLVLQGSHGNICQ